VALGRGFDHVRVFEAGSKVGGVWNFDSKRSSSNPMYAGLVSNLPKCIMQFSEASKFIGDPSTSFATHQEVQRYLEEFSRAQGVDDIVELNSRVVSVERTDDDGGGWIVAREGGARDTFDAVVVCNGHYSKPHWPARVPGTELFGGRMMHSKEYDSSLVQELKGQSVLVVGARASATDIARELSRTCHTVVVADRGLNELVGSSASGTVGLDYKHRAGLTAITGERTVEFFDGQQAEVDVIIMATGFDYDFEFLEGVVSQDERAVRPLFEHVFYMDDPTLSFIGLTHSNVPFPLFLLQAHWVASVLSGEAALPTTAQRREWLASYEADVKTKGGWPRNYHHQGDAQWGYCKRVAEHCGMLTEALAAYIDTNEAIYNDNKSHMPTHPGGDDAYRRRLFSAVDRASASFTVQEPNPV
jgi:cation diffusion facilitator CzcD-associated flavoprotein CzcO